MQRMPSEKWFLPGFGLLAAAVLLTLSCGGGENSGTPVAPTTPRPPPRQLTGLEVFVERTQIRVGQAVGPLVAYGQYDDGTTGSVNATWTSSDPAVAEVAEDGIVTGVSAGVVEINATFESFTETVDFEVDEPNPRNTRDQPDDTSGPQIHVVYALPSDVEDGNLDRYGDIARSFAAIQNWLSEDIGYRLLLDTYGGDLDVTFLRLPFTHQEGDGRSGSLVFDLEQAIRDSIGIAPNKIYAVYYGGRSAGVCGSANLGGPVGAVYVHRDGCSNSSPGMDPEVASTYEGVMVHELLHVYGAVASCAPHQGGGAHVQDDPADVMYAGTEREPRAEALVDVGRDDYFGHGRADCLDTANSRFWERVESRRAWSPGRRSSHVDIPVADWPLRCELH